MKALKYFAGVVLATVGVVFAIGAIIHFLDPGPDVSFWATGMTFVALALIGLGGAFGLLKNTVLAHGKLCPQCGGAERQAAGVLRRHHNFWLFHTCGWMISLLWGLISERQVRCVPCDALYFTSTRGSRIAGVIFWVFVLLLLFGLLVDLMG